MRMIMPTVMMVMATLRVCQEARVDVDIDLLRGLRLLCENFFSEDVRNRIGDFVFRISRVDLIRGDRVLRDFRIVDDIVIVDIFIVDVVNIKVDIIAIIVGRVFEEHTFLHFLLSILILTRFY